MRHAKSDWSDLDLRDFDRPLNERGRTDAPEMGQRLLKKMIKPDKVISSTAVRALDTCKIICHTIAYKEQAIIEEPRIYEAAVPTLLDIVNHLDNDKDVVALFGHNNGITDFAVYLTGSDIYNIPTCGMVLIEFPFDDWRMVNKGCGELVFFDYPKKS